MKELLNAALVLEVFCKKGGSGAINIDFDIFVDGAYSVWLIKALAIAMIAMRTTGQTSSQMEAPNVRFHTIQFFFIKAQKCLVRVPIFRFSIRN